jgi:hypothetical protein
MALLHDRQKQLYHSSINHHGIMAMAACIIIKLGRQQGGLQGSGELMKNQVEAVRDRTVVPTDVQFYRGRMNTSAMNVFQMQQCQYYAMLMAQQQQVAMAAGNPAMMAPATAANGSVSTTTTRTNQTHCSGSCHAEEQELKESVKEEENAKV